MTNSMTPLPPDYTIGTAQHELDAIGHITTDYIAELRELLDHLENDGSNDKHAAVTLDWAAQIAFLEGMNRSDALAAAKILYFG